MDRQQKILIIAAHTLLYVYALGNLLMLFLAGRFDFGGDQWGPYSIFSSQKVFIAYHIWSVILPVITSIALLRKNRKIFLISLLLLVILLFYPWFTSYNTSPEAEINGNSIPAAPSAPGGKGYRPGNDTLRPGTGDSVFLDNG